MTLSTWDKNIQALEKTHPKLLEQLLEIPDTDDVQPFLCGEHEDVNLSVAGLPLHDMVDPFQEAMEIFEAHVPKDKRTHQSIIFQFGMGLGYLFKRTFVHTKSCLIVYEPFLAVLKKTLQIVDYSKELSTTRVRIVTTKEQVLGAIAEFYLLGDNMMLLSLPVYEQLQGDLLVQVLEEVKSSLYTNVIRQNTAILAMEMSAVKSLNNIPHLVKYPEVSFLHDKFEGMPGILVSAGPSLDRPGVIEKLREIQDRVVIVCVGQAAKVLDAEGIKPDFVVILESRDVTNQITGTSFLEDLNLVMLPQANEALWTLPTKRKLVSYAVDEALTYWLSEAVDKSYIPYRHTGTVSITGLLLLMKLGCNAIYMLGQDLAFPEGKGYSDKSVYKGRRIIEKADGTRELQWANKEEFFGREGFLRDQAHYDVFQQQWCDRLTYVKGWKGEDLLTDTSYAAFKQGFEVIGRHHSGRLVNCSEGGAFIENYEHIPFLEAIADVDFTQYNPKSVLESLFDKHYQEETDYSEAYQKVADRYAKERLELVDVRQRVKDGKAEIAKAVVELDEKKTFTHSLQSRLRRITEIDEVLTQMTEDNGLINSFVQSEIFLYTKGYDRKTAQEDDIEVGNIEQIRDNLSYTNLLYDAAEKGCRRLMEEMDRIFTTDYPAKFTIPEETEATAAQPG